MPGIETFRKQLIELGDYATAHSMNQERLKSSMDGERRLFGKSKKALRSERKRLKAEAGNQDNPV